MAITPNPSEPNPRPADDEVDRPESRTADKSGADVPDHDGIDEVDEWGLESFPASDPPSH
jgi:hypothetical protein